MNREVVFDLIYANVAHPVERHLPKVDVAGSSPVIRFVQKYRINAENSVFMRFFAFFKMVIAFLTTTTTCKSKENMHDR